MAKIKKRPSVEYSDVRTSIRDLAKIYKPKDAKAFVRSFIHKYNVQKGYEEELEAIVLEALKETGGSENEI
ncbi:MAG TPA: hypothetical protein IAA29_12015 [Candidatus Paenibacillus intestinavium]|nr:hypothetical protein [Candidatus Paenibacillus intestinavium]